MICDSFVSALNIVDRGAMMRAVPDPSHNSRDNISSKRASELMTGIAAGDAAAYESFVREFGPFVLARALRTVRDRDLAEDVTQTVLSAVWSKAGSFQAVRGNLFAWLQTMTRNAGVDALRVEGRHRRNSEVMLRGAKVETESSVGAGLEREVHSQVVRTALAQLGEDQRIAIELAYFHDLSYVEVAERLGEPEGTVKSRIRRGMKQMARLVGDLDE